MKIRGQKWLKLIDRYAGIPAIYLLGALRKKKSLPAKIRTIGVLLTPAIGDTLVCSAPLKDMKEQLKPEKIIFFVPAENRQSAELTGLADEIVTFNLGNPARTFKLFRQNKFDVFIDTSQWARLNSFLTLITRSKYKIGFDTNNQYRKFTYDKAAKHSNEVHEIDNFRNLIALTGAVSESLPYINADAKTDPKKITLHINPGGYLSYLKEWQKENWIKVIEYLRMKGFSIYFTGSKSDNENVESLLNMLSSRDNLFNISGRLDLKETAEHLKSSFLLISVNTGIMHLGAAVGTNIIALHGPTNHLRWGPLNKNSISIQSSYHSSPCLNLGFEYNCMDRTGECMKAIRVEEVIDAINIFIAEKREL